MVIDTTGWTCMSMYEKVITMKLEHEARYRKLKNVFDLIGLHGYKRMNEYKMFKCAYSIAKVERYYINAHHEMVEDDYVVDKSRKDKVYDINAFDITIDTKKSIVMNAFTELRSMAHDSKELYAACVKWCIDNDYADQHLFQKMLEKTAGELKYTDRHIMKLKNIQYNFDYIVCWQDDIHDSYKCKTEDMKIEFL